MSWQWTDDSRTVATIDLGKGVTRSAAIAAPDLADFLATGGVPLDPPPAAAAGPSLSDQVGALRTVVATLLDKQAVPTKG